MMSSVLFSEQKVLQLDLFRLHLHQLLYKVYRLIVQEDEPGRLPYPHNHVHALILSSAFGQFCVHGSSQTAPLAAAALLLVVVDNHCELSAACQLVSQTPFK